MNRLRCPLIVWTMMATACYAEEGVWPAIEVTFTNTPISVDGDPRDWQGVCRHPIANAWEGGERAPDDDLAVEAAFRFDDSHFYVLVEVRDDLFEFPDRSWRYGDGLYLTFAEPTPTFRSSQFITLGLSREGDGIARRVVYSGGKAFPNIDTSGVQLHVVTDSEAGRLIYEAALPWSLLTPLQPLVDETWGFNLIYVDRDEGQREVLLLEPDRHYDTERTRVRRSRPIRFSFADARKQLVQLRPYRTHVRCGEAFPVRVATLNLKAGAAVVEWRMTTGEGRKVARGSLSHTIGDGISRSRVEIPVGDLPSGPIRVIVTLRDEAGRNLRRELFPALVCNTRELAEQKAAVQRFAEGEDVPEALRVSLPSVLFRLEAIDAFLAEAAPFQETGDVQAYLRGVRLALDDLNAGRPVFAELRGIIRHAHRSKIDGTLQPYSVAIPQSYDPQRRCPLMVMLHGSGVDERDVYYDASLVARELNWIVMAPKARGLSDWYLGDSGRDVFECIADVRKRYAIDAECIVISGFSAGGFGALRLGLLRPELFAGIVALSAPLICGDEDLGAPLAKVEGVPIFLAHGTADTACSIEHARRAAAILRERGYPLLHYREIEGAGHGGYLLQIMPELGAWLGARQPASTAAAD